MRIIISFLVLLFSIHAYAQNATPKREFRAVWIATVGNIDWPSKQGLDAETQKAEFRAILAQAKKDGLNAVIVQIRPAADALYDSPYENWSHYLSGHQGQAPTPYYDPLTFMIDDLINIVSSFMHGLILTEPWLMLIKIQTMRLM